MARSCEGCGSRMSPFIPRKRREADGKLVCAGCEGLNPQPFEAVRKVATRVSCSNCSADVTIAGGTASATIPSNKERGSRHVPAHGVTSPVIQEDGVTYWECPVCGHADSYDAQHYARRRTAVSEIEVGDKVTFPGGSGTVKSIDGDEAMVDTHEGWDGRGIIGVYLDEIEKTGARKVAALSAEQQRAIDAAAAVTGDERGRLYRGTPEPYDTIAKARMGTIRALFDKGLIEVAHSAGGGSEVVSGGWGRDWSTRQVPVEHIYRLTEAGWASVTNQTEATRKQASSALFYVTAPGRRYATMTLHTADCPFVTSPKFTSRPITGGWITEHGEAREPGNLEQYDRSDSSKDVWDDSEVGQRAFARHHIEKAQAGDPQYAICGRCHPEQMLTTGSRKVASWWFAHLIARKPGEDGWYWITHPGHFSGQGDPEWDTVYRYNSVEQWNGPFPSVDAAAKDMLEGRANVGHIQDSTEPIPDGLVSQMVPENKKRSRRNRWASRQVHAHDSGDGETIYHCPFCGAGQVVGRSDGTAECGFCQAVFTVQVQPNMAAVPQTIDGTPHVHPDMPGGEPGTPEDEVDPEAEVEVTNVSPERNLFARRTASAGEEMMLRPSEFEPGDILPDPLSGAGERVRDTTFVSGGVEVTKEMEDGSTRTTVYNGRRKYLVIRPSKTAKRYVTAAGVALPEDAYLRHLAIQYAHDPEGVLEAIRAERERA